MNFLIKTLSFFPTLPIPKNTTGLAIQDFVVHAQMQHFVEPSAENFTLSLNLYENAWKHYFS